MAASRRRRVEAEFSIKLKKDGTLEAMPAAQTRAGQSVSSASSRRAGCARSSNARRTGCLAAFFEEWKYFNPVFDSRDL